MLRRSLLASCAFVAASALNPAYLTGCVAGDDDDPGFEYGAAEMAALVKQANGTHLTEEDGVKWRVEVNIAPETKPAAASAGPSAWNTTAHACGNRTLFASAQACIDSSSMAVKGSVKIVQLGTDVEKTFADMAIESGELSVLSLKLSHAELRLRLADAWVELISSDGKTFDQIELSVKH